MRTLLFNLLVVSVCALGLIECASVKITYQKLFDGLDSGVVGELIESEPHLDVNIQNIRPTVEISHSDGESVESDLAAPPHAGFINRLKLKKVNFLDFSPDSDEHSRFLDFPPRPRIHGREGLGRYSDMDSSYYGGSYEASGEEDRLKTLHGPIPLAETHHVALVEEKDDNVQAYKEFMQRLLKTKNEDNYETHAEWLGDLHSSGESDKSNEKPQIVGYKTRHTYHDPSRFHSVYEESGEPAERHPVAAIEEEDDPNVQAYKQLMKVPRFFSFLSDLIS
jgi:hypothetical protein